MVGFLRTAVLVGAVPEIQRAKETNLAFVHAYQCGWWIKRPLMFLGQCLDVGLYMDGLSDVVLPGGDVAAATWREPVRRDEEVILVTDVPLS